VRYRLRLCVDLNHYILPSIEVCYESNVFMNITMVALQTKCLNLPGTPVWNKPSGPYLVSQAEVFYARPCETINLDIQCVFARFKDARRHPSGAKEANAKIDETRVAVGIILIIQTRALRLVDCTVSGGHGSCDLMNDTKSGGEKDGRKGWKHVGVFR
jgi:hypothetical protein